MRSLSRRQIFLFALTFVLGGGLISWMILDAVSMGEVQVVTGCIALLAFFVLALFLYIRRSIAMVHLRESEVRYRLVMDHATDAIFIVSPEGRYVDCNAAAETMTGYSRDELLQLGPLDLIVSEQHEEVRERIAASAAGETTRAERRFRRKDGTIITVEIGAGRLSDERFISIGRDVTGRKEAEEALESRAQLFRAVSELTSDYAWSMYVMEDGTLEWEWVTDGFQRLLGITPQQMQEQGGWESVIHPDDLPHTREIFGRLFTEARSFATELRMLRSDGQALDVRSWIGSVRDEETGRPVKLFGAIQDITGIRSAADELERREELFRAVSELTSDYVYSMVVEPDGSLTPDWFTGAFEKVTGYKVEESHARGGWMALVHPDDLPRLSESFKTTLTDPAAQASEDEFRIIAKTGEMRYVRAWVQPVWDEEQGRVVRIYGAVSDITEAKRLEQDLRESRERFENLYQRLPIGIYQRTWDGEGIAANPACVEILGYPDPDTFTRAMPEQFYVDTEDRERWLELLERHEVVGNFEVRLRRYDGGIIWVRNTGRVVRDDSGKVAYVEGAIQDITEQKRVEEQLRFALSTLQRTDEERRRLLTHLVRAKEDERNRVASDIHDDSVQVMTSVAISLERLVRSVSDKEQHETLSRLEESVRAAIGRLRKMVFELRPPALDEEGLASALRLYLEELKLDTGIEYRLENGLDKEPPSDLRVVLYRVAQEALTNVRKHSGATRIVVKLTRTEGGVGLVVADDGVGFDTHSIDSPVPGHIGFSEMRERTEMAGGSLELDSLPGDGSTVRVWVPELVEVAG